MPPIQRSRRMCVKMADPQAGSINFRLVDFDGPPQENEKTRVSIAGCLLRHLPDGQRQLVAVTAAVAITVRRSVVVVGRSVAAVAVRRGVAAVAIATVTVAKSARLSRRSAHQTGDDQTRDDKDARRFGFARCIRPLLRNEDRRKKADTAAKEFLIATRNRMAFGSSSYCLSAAYALAAAT
jgi:hypothetical protein